MRAFEAAAPARAGRRGLDLARPRSGASALGLLLIVAAALWLRLLWLWPPEQGIVQAPYDDEGVYAMAARLLSQGILPYRDYFFAHPPLGIAALLPAAWLAPTPWGSPLGFGLGRVLMAALGGLTVVLIGLAGGRLWGIPGGLIAAGLLALDPVSVANSRHIMLETPMGLAVAAALLASVTVGERPRGALLTGLLAGLAALVKVQAGGLGVALALTLAARRRWRPLGALLAGLALAGALLVGLALLVGPGPMLRQMVLFQVLRPADGLADQGARLASLLAPGGLLLGLAGAALGLAVAGLAGVAGERRSRWLPVALWVGLGLGGFLLSNSYYQHYASQLAPGLALLAGGLGTAWRPARPRRWLAPAAMLGLVLMGGVVAAGLPPAVARREDDTFVRVARYLSQAVPPTGAALTTDAQFNLLAARPLPRAAGGYLVDSYGQLVYAGLGLAEGSLATAAATAWQTRAATVHEITWRPAAQALLRSHLAAADEVVIHAVGRSRLTPETLAWLTDRFDLIESNRRYDIYRRRR